MFKSNYIKLILTSAVVMQLSACGGLDGTGAPVTFGSATVNWTAPNFREDGVTNLPLNEIGGYRVYYGPSAGNYIREIDVESDGTISSGSVTVEDLPAGRTYYFVITTYDTEGRESLFSDEIPVPI